MALLRRSSLAKSFAPPDGGEDGVDEGDGEVDEDELKKAAAADLAERG